MKYENYRAVAGICYKLLGQATNLLLPPRCPVTGDIVDKAGMVSPAAWSALRFVSAPQCSCCGIPFEVLADALPDDDREILCGPCLANPKPYSQARSSLVYDDASRSLILAFKHGDQTHLTVTFAPWLLTAANDMLREADVIVPVPLHWMRLLRRRYNQAALLGHSLAELSGKECWPDVLQRKKNTVTQGHLNYKQRHENVSRAFAIKPEYGERIKDKRIVLIDDVHTTGATIEECTEILVKAGVQRVDVLTLARVVKPDFVS
jgi:ComF family protein